MRSEEQLFTQIATREISCPCNEKCISKPPQLPGAFKNLGIAWVHESFQQYMTCLSRYVSEFVRDRIREMRMHAERKLHLPLEVFRIVDENANPDVYIDSIKEHKLHFALTNNELDQLIIRNLFT